jgi:hypothetical protein
MLINPTKHLALRRLQGDWQRPGNPKLNTTIPLETKNSIDEYNKNTICIQLFKIVSAADQAPQLKRLF